MARGSGSRNGSTTSPTAANGATRSTRRGRRGSSRGGDVPVPIPNRLADPAAFVDDLDVDALVLTGGNDLAHLPGAQQRRARTRRHRARAARARAATRAARCSACAVGCRCSWTPAARCTASTGHVGAAAPIDVVPTTRWPLRPGPVNSFHDWGIARAGVPAALEVLAVAPDGTVEAVAHRELPEVGVMWHPGARAGRRRPTWLLAALARRRADARGRARGGGGHPAAAATPPTARSAWCRSPGGRCSRGSSTRCRAPASTTSPSSPATAATWSPPARDRSTTRVRRTNMVASLMCARDAARRRRRRARRVRRHRVRAAARRGAGATRDAGSAMVGRHGSGGGSGSCAWRIRSPTPRRCGSTPPATSSSSAGGPTRYADIEGQYLGLIAVRAASATDWCDALRRARPDGDVRRTRPGPHVHDRVAATPHRRRRAGRRGARRRRLGRGRHARRPRRVRGAARPRRARHASWTGGGR